MFLAISIIIGLLLALAGWIYFGGERHHRTELKLDRFELVTTRERHWLGWRVARDEFVRTTYLSAAARAASSAAVDARVLVDATRPGVRGHHGVGRHLVQLMALRGERNGFAAWSRQHPAETERMLRLLAGAIATRGAEQAAQQLRELLVVGAANHHATFTADIDTHLQ